MADWNAAAADYLDELSRRPAARPAATIGEIWNAEWTRSGLDTISGVGRPFTESYDALAGAIEKHGGSDIGTLAYRHGVNMGAAVTPDLRIAALNTIADGLPEEARKAIEPLRDVRSAASDRAQAIEREASDVAASTQGLSGVATMFLAGVARQALDPINLTANVITAPIGGTLTGPVLRMVARQGAAGAAAQILVEPYVQSTRAELGLESGVAHGAMNVAQAALGAAGLAGLLRAASAAFKLARGPRTQPGAIADGAPAFEPTFVGYMDAEQAAAFDRGHAVAATHPLAGQVPDTIPGFAGAFDIAEGAQARPGRGRTPEPAPPPSDFVPFDMAAEDLAALNRGSGVDPVHGLAAFAPDFANGLDIAAGAGARPIRSRAVPEPQPPSDFVGGYDVGAFDQGHPLDTTGGVGDTTGRSWRGFDGLSSADLEAAARLVERDQLLEQAAPPSWDRAVHHAMVDEAAAALEAGRPIDRAKAADALAANGHDAPAVVPVADNAIAEASRAIAPAKSKRFGVHATPPEKFSLFQFLASMGGLDPDQPAIAQGWLQKILDGNPFVPGFGQLIRKGGMKLDRAWRNAAEAGYLGDTGVNTRSDPASTSVNDLLDRIAEEHGGNKVYRLGQERAPKLDPAEQKALLEAHRAELATAFEQRMVQLEITKIPKRERTRALKIMEKEGQADPLLALEQAQAEYEAKKEAIRAKRLENEKLHLPGWDVADDAGAASPHGANVPGQSEPGPGGGAAGGSPRPAGEGAGTAGGEGQLGDPALAADYDRLLEQHGEDLQTTIRLPDGTLQSMSAREAMQLAEEEARAAAEMFDCIGVKPGAGE